MIIGVVQLGASAKRLDATFYLDPTRHMDRQIASARRRMAQDRARLRVLVKQRREVLRISRLTASIR